MAEGDAAAATTGAQDPAAAGAAENAGAEKQGPGEVISMDIDSDIEEVGSDLYKVDLGEELQAEEGSNSGASLSDPELLPRDGGPFPVLYPPEESEATGRKKKVVDKIEEEATKALQSGDAQKAVERYTEAMRIGGSTALMLAMRAALLLRLRRPCAAIRDCTAAIQINAMILKAYRLRGIAHRKLGHWKKSHRDLTKAQSLNFDSDTAALLKVVNERLNGTKPGAAAPKAAAQPAAPKRGSAPAAVPVVKATPAAPEPPAAPEKEFSNGQAVLIGGLQKAPHLNGKRGVVMRRDPHPSRKGRWEVEIRLGGGKTNTMALKGDNIITLNKADKVACKEWMKEEKQHKLDAKKLEEAELEKWRGANGGSDQPSGDGTAARPGAQQSEASAQEKAKPDGPQDPADLMKARIAGLRVEDKVKSLLRQLDLESATEILDRAARAGSDITNLDAYLTNQAKMVLGSDSEEEGEGDGEAGSDDEKDPARMKEETEAFPPLGSRKEATDAEQRQAAQAKQEAAEAVEAKDLILAVAKYTVALRAAGLNALTLAKRADTLLQARRPMAAIRDCNEALKVNPESGKALRVRGLARRALGHWEDAQRDLEKAQQLDFDQDVKKVQTLVALKVNALQERGPTRRRTSGGGPPAKKAKV
eukprot:TRINITY_DN104546_c0_g1_i1.p1 TRINITY_DN104546_c0_g1~~TRINITY_DN104546_c0_g1_i1.p1  ORF type:complete len:647 (-),score=222.25 TRINITY_DN104546_c0_g1_i1:72-2012(-)